MIFLRGWARLLNTIVMAQTSLLIAQDDGTG
jgi:hypothetical protein